MLSSVDEVVVHRICSDWLDVRDIARLDSAYCERRSRALFLSTCCGKYTVYGFDGDNNEAEWNRFIAWVNLRNLFINRLTVTAELMLNVDLRRTVLPRCAPKTTNVWWKSEYNPSITVEIVDQTVFDLVTYCPNITFMDFHGLERERHRKPISLRSLCQSTQKGMQLTHLNLSHSSIGDEAFLLALPFLHPLTVLKVNWCRDLTDLTLSQIGPSCPLLEELGLTSACRSDDVLYNIVKHCPRLHTVDLLCADITDTAVRHLVEHCPQLRSIDLVSTKVTKFGHLELARYCQLTEIRLNDEYNLTKATVIEMVKLSPALHVLTMVNFHSLTDDVLMTIAATCPHFTSLNVSGCTLITDEGIAALALACTHLRTLNLDYCRRVTDVGLTALASHCPGLFELSIKYLRFVTDVTLCTLVKYCVRLERFTCAMCTKLTGPGVLHLLQGCRRLNYLDSFSYSNSVADAVCAALRALHPRRIRMPEYDGNAEYYADQTERDLLRWEMQQGIEDSSQIWG